MPSSPAGAERPERKSSPRKSAAPVPARRLGPAGQSASARKINAMKRQSQSETERQRALLDLWLQRSEEERTENHVLGFYRELLDNRPDLLVLGHGDPYQQLHADLRRHIRRN